jgi:hypothetical protein
MQHLMKIVCSSLRPDNQKKGRIAPAFKALFPVRNRNKTCLALWYGLYLAIQLIDERSKRAPA